MIACALKVVLSLMLLTALFAGLRLMTASHAQSPITIVETERLPPTYFTDLGTMFLTGQPLILNSEVAQSGPSIDRAIEHHPVLEQLQDNDLAPDGCNYYIRDSAGRIIGQTTMACEGNTVTMTAPTVDERCLAQMEAAMRAMEPYLSYFPDDGQADTRMGFRSPYKGASAAVMQQWIDAKRTCWSQP